MGIYFFIVEFLKPYFFYYQLLNKSELITFNKIFATDVAQNRFSSAKVRRFIKFIIIEQHV